MNKQEEAIKELELARNEAAAIVNELAVKILTFSAGRTNFFELETIKRT